MFDIIVVSHGSFGRELVASAEMIAGQQERVYAFGLKPGCDLGKFKNSIEDVFAKVAANGKFLVLTDLMYGTPFNTVACFMNKYDFSHFSGVNMPILLECLTSRKCREIDELCQFIKEEGKTTFVFVNDLLEEEKCE